MSEKKRKRALTAEERETIISFDDSGQRCQIYTCSRPMMPKLDKLCKNNPKSYRLVSRDAAAKLMEQEQSKPGRSRQWIS